MKIEINGDCGAEELANLFKSVGWTKQEEKKLLEAFSYTWRWLTVRSTQGMLIGFARILSDGIRHAYICNMAIAPDNQRQGIGSKLMNSMLDLLKQNGLLPSLVATPGNQGFYTRFGFMNEDNGFAAMCIRKQP